MILYKIVDNIEETKICDDLLTELIMSERKYDDNVKETYVVNNYYTEMFNRDYNVLICVKHNDIIIGFIYGFIKYEKGDLVKENVGFIDAVYVKNEYRKQGIASGLVEEFYKWCKSKDVKYVEVSSYIKNEGACNLYKKFGFETTSYYMRKSI